jgi:hypothetical protein
MSEGESPQIAMSPVAVPLVRLVHGGALSGGIASGTVMSGGETVSDLAASGGEVCGTHLLL